MRTVRDFGGWNFGGKVILDVEDVSPRGIIDRRVLAPDVGARLLCEEMIQPGGQTASLLAEWRRGSPDSCQQQ